MRRAVRFLRRGRVVEATGFKPRATLLDYLRLIERRTGTKEGCAEGDCGACTVVLGRLRGERLVYEPVNACIMLLGQVDGAELVTVEDLAEAGALHPVQSAMVEQHGSQCGFCTPGIVMSLFALHHGAAPPSRAAIDEALAGNLCRCTGYRPIVEAARSACAAPAADRFALAGEETARRLAELRDDAGVAVGDDARFFAAPASEDALAALYAAHPEATLVAGATDVGLWITKALRDLDRIIWLGRVAGLDAVSVEADRVTLGATATHAQARPALAAIDPDLGEMLRRFGSVQVRAAGTVGGSIANGSPIGDLAPALIALDATLELRRGETVRTMPLEEFFLAYGRQDRGPGEFVRRLTVPRLRASERFRCLKVSKRFDEDISAVLGAFRFTLADGRVAAARIAYGGMAGTPKRAAAAEAALVGSLLDDPEGWEPAVAALAEDYQPLADHRASAGYRGLVAKNLLRKALAEVAGADSRETRLVGHRESEFSA
jgi:xanthine dehydrogenase small subunit